MELFKLFGTIAVDNAAANKAIDETANKSEESESRITSAFKRIGAVVATAFAADQLIGFGKSVVDATAGVAAEQSAFEQIMGDYTQTANDKVNKIADNTGMVSSRLTPYMTSMTAKFKGLGFDISSATDHASDGLTLAADAAAFWDKSLDESMSGLNSFVNGSYEGGEAIGLFANETQMAQYAISKGIVKSTSEWQNLDEATKQATRLDYAKAMFEQSGATGQAAKESGQYANVQANLTEKWRQFKAQIGQPLLQNIVIPAMSALMGIVQGLEGFYQQLNEKVQQFSQWLQDNQAVAAVLVGVLAAVGTGLAIMAVKAITAAVVTNAVTIATNLAAAAQWLLNAAMSANPISLIIIAIVALVAAFMYLWNNSEDFRNFWIGLWDTVSSYASTAISWIQGFFTGLISFIQNNWQSILTFIVNPFAGAFNLLYDKCEWFRSVVDNLKNGIINIWNSARDTLSGIIDSIKNFFNFTWELPRIKLPHFNISGEFSLNPPSAPSIGVDWYAKGGILNRPTIFGVNASNNRLQVGGEAGAEAIAPIDTLLGYVQSAVHQENEGLTYYLQRLTSMLAEYFPELISNMNRDVVLSTGETIGALTPYIDKRLGDISKLRDRGR